LKGGSSAAGKDYDIQHFSCRIKQLSPTTLPEVVLSVSSGATDE